MAEQEARAFTLIKKDAEATLRNHGVALGSTIMSQKLPPGTVGRNLMVATNVHCLEVKNPTIIFRYEVKIYANPPTRPNCPPRRVDLTIATNEDYPNVEHRFYTEAVYQTYKHKMGHLMSGNVFYYDLKRILYTIKEIPNAALIFHCDAESIKDLFRDDFQSNFVSFVMEIVPASTEKFRLTLGQFNHINADAARIDRSLEQFLDIATSQEVFDNPDQFINFSASRHYLLNPADYGFVVHDCPYFGANHSFLGVGVNKSVRPMGDGNNIFHGLAVEVKKTPFHLDGAETVLNKARQILGEHLQIPDDSTKDKLQKSLKDIYVRTSYLLPSNQYGVFAIDGLSENDARGETVTRNGNTQSIFDYYRTERGITLRHPELPLLLRRKRIETQKAFYPMEVCIILDNQRVKGDQQDRDQIAEMIRKCAIPPFLMRSQKEEVKRSLNLVGSQYMDYAGHQFNNHAIETKARVIPQPDITFGANRVEKPKEVDGTFRTQAAYLLPAQCTKWAVVAFSGDKPKTSINQTQWNEFLKAYVHTMQLRGMQWPPPYQYGIMQESPNFNMEEFFDKLFIENFEFILIGHPDSDDKIHRIMKYCERKTEVISQGVQLTTILKAPMKPDTTANIVHKTNMKMGGINYAILPSNPEIKTLFDDDTLIIGFAMNHPGGVFSIRELEELLQGPNGKRNGAQRNGLNGNGTNGNGVNRPANGANIPTTSTAATAPTTSTGAIAEVIPDGPQIPPGVIGFSANIGQNHRIEFIGDYYFQPPYQDARVEIIANIMKRCVEGFQKVRKNLPSRVIMLRNGCAEGYYQYILTYEVPLVKKILADLGCNAKITLLVINKLQSVRFYAQQIDKNKRDLEQNIEPGTVVDTTVVHPKWTEFMLNPHASPQGTCRTPRYNVLIDENLMSIDTLQSMVHHLCFAHQICFNPTSLPTPVFIALEYAKRGRENYNAMLARLRSEVTPPTNGDEYNNLTERLGVEGTTFLKNLRFNA